MKKVLSTLLFLSMLLFLTACVASNPSKDGEFVEKNNSKISQIIQQQLDPKHQHIKKVTVEMNSVKGYYDNGGDVGGNYHLDFKAYANGNKNYEMTCKIDFPNAAIGPFTFKQPDPYAKPENMTFDYIDVETQDNSQKNIMKSWWNWNDKIYLDNFNISSLDENSEAHKQLEEVYIRHRDNIIAAFKSSLASENPNTQISQLTETDAGDGYFRITDDGDSDYLQDGSLHVSIIYRYQLGNKAVGDDDSGEGLTFYLTRENLKNMQAPLTIEINDKKQTIPADNNQDKKVELKAFHAAIEPAKEADEATQQSIEDANAAAEAKDKQQRNQIMTLYKAHQKGLLALAKATAPSKYHKVTPWNMKGNSELEDYDAAKGTAVIAYALYKKDSLFSNNYPDAELQIQINFDPKKLNDTKQTIKARAGVYDDNKDKSDWGEWKDVKGD